MWIERNWLRLESIRGFCELGNELVVSMKGAGFLSQQVTIVFSKKGLRFMCSVMKENI
jgi:hypothetical protein